MGDGNHSLATAKAIWEKNKAQVGMGILRAITGGNLKTSTTKGWSSSRLSRGVRREAGCHWRNENAFGDRFNYFVSPANEMIRRVENPAKTTVNPVWSAAAGNLAS